MSIRTSSEILALRDVEALTFDALRRAGASELSATAMACAIRAAEAHGHRRLGLALAPTIIEHLRSGRVVGEPAPKLHQNASQAFTLDAGGGFAEAALTLPLALLDGAFGVAGMARISIVNAYPLALPEIALAPLLNRGLTLGGQCHSLAGVYCPNGEVALEVRATPLWLHPDGAPKAPSEIGFAPPGISPRADGFEGPLGGAFSFSHELVLLDMGQARAVAPPPEARPVEVSPHLLERLINA